MLDDRLAVEALAAAEGVHAILREDEVEPRVQVAVQLHRLLLEVARADDADRVSLAQRAEHIYGRVVGALRRHRERAVDVEEDERGAVLAVGKTWRHRGGGEGFSVQRMLHTVGSAAQSTKLLNACRAYSPSSPISCDRRITPSSWPANVT